MRVSRVPHLAAGLRPAQVLGNTPRLRRRLSFATPDCSTLRRILVASRIIHYNVRTGAEHCDNAAARREKK
jgi:hypothetical protein